MQRIQGYVWLIAVNWLWLSSGCESAKTAEKRSFRRAASTAPILTTALAATTYALEQPVEVVFEEIERSSNGEGEPSQILSALVTVPDCLVDEEGLPITTRAEIDGFNLRVYVPKNCRTANPPLLISSLDVGVKGYVGSISLATNRDGVLPNGYLYRLNSAANRIQIKKLDGSAIVRTGAEKMTGSVHIATVSNSCKLATLTKESDEVVVLSVYGSFQAPADVTTAGGGISFRSIVRQDGSDVATFAIDTSFELPTGVHQRSASLKSTASGQEQSCDVTAELTIQDAIKPPDAETICPNPPGLMCEPIPGLFQAPTDTYCQMSRLDSNPPIIIPTLCPADQCLFVAWNNDPENAVVTAALCLEAE